VAALKPAEILPIVSASFSIAGAAFVPSMVLGIFWRGTTRQGVVAGMLSGLLLTVYYLLAHTQWARDALPAALLVQQPWLGIEPISAGVFGVPLGFVVTWLVSLITRPGKIERIAPDGL
jgi:cation/acetate symporter